MEIAEAAASVKLNASTQRLTARREAALLPQGRQLTRSTKPLFVLETALAKVKMAEVASSSRDPVRCLCSQRDFTMAQRLRLPPDGDEIYAFLRGKRAKELDYRLEKTARAGQPVEESALLLPRLGKVGVVRHHQFLKRVMLQGETRATWQIDQGSAARSGF